ncbi:hypothetical protein [Streptomyces alfalfae]
MSGCCGQGPVIVSGANPAARVDVEAVLLCDVLADGTVAATVLLEPVYDAATGARVGTRTVDPVTGADYLVTGELQACPPPEACSCETVPLCHTPPGDPGPTTSPVPLTATGQPTTHTISGAPRQGDTTDATAIWAGQTVTIPGTAAGASDPGAHTHYTVGLAPGTPDCGTLDPAGDVEITAAVTYTNDGPGGGWDWYGRLSLWVEGDAAPVAADNFGQGSDAFFPAGSTRTATITGTVPIAALQAGDVSVEFDLETGPNGTLGTPEGDQAKTWTVTGAALTATAAVTGCALGTADAPVPFLRTICRTCSGTATVTDTALDGTTPYDASTGTVSTCPGDLGCASPTTPTATVGLCLADGTPIAVTVIRDCDGQVSSEGWLNLSTGAWSAGAPPAGTVACGDSRSIQVSGTFCAVDDTGEVVGLVLVEYTYDDTGAISAVRLVDAITGGDYVPPAGVTVTTCPAGVEQPEQDAVILCHTAAGGAITQIVRDFRRDETGAIVGHSDYTLDGNAFDATGGTVGVCPPPCRPTHAEVLCDSAPQTLALSTQYRPLSEAPIDTVANEIDLGPVAGQQLWDGQTVTVGPTSGVHDLTYVVGALGVTCPGCGDPDDEVAVTVSVDVTFNGPAAGSGSTGGLQMLNGTTSLGAVATPASTAVGWSGTLALTQTVPLADLRAGQVIVRLGLETSQDGAKDWTLTGWTATAERAAAGCGAQFLRTYVRDCVTGEVTETLDTTLDGADYDPVGAVARCRDAEPCTDACLDCETVQLCDTPVGPDDWYAYLDHQSGTLPNGRAYTLAGLGGAVLAQPGVYALPATGTGTTFTFTEPVQARWKASLNAGAVVQFPAGTVLQELHPNHAWNPATAQLTGLTGATTSGAPSQWSRFSHPGLTVLNLRQTTAPPVAFAGDYEFALPAPTPFLRTLCRGCDGAVTSTTDTLLDGSDYEPTGTVGVCHPHGCRDCETLLLCDLGEPATVTGMEASGTLPNGVSWTATNAATTGTGQPQLPAFVNSGDVTWWSVNKFPNVAVGPTRFTFSRPSVAEFSIYLNYSTTTPAINTAQLPAGLEVVHLPDGYVYETSTGVLTRTRSSDPCTYVTDPQAMTSARFRTPGPVTSFVTAPAPNSRASVCGRFITYIAGALTVTPGGQFLRTICRDCDGAVVSVTDSTLDGEPYTATGAVGACPEPCDTSVVSECTYRLPDMANGFDTEQTQFPGCWLGVQTNPRYVYGDRVTYWEGSYQAAAGTPSAVGFIVNGGGIDFSAFTPALPVDPTQSPVDYVGTGTASGGVPVTLRALGGNGLMRSGGTLLMLNPGDRFSLEFAEPVTLTVYTSAFADPPTAQERLCGVVAETVPWPGVKVADCKGVTSVVDEVTRQPVPATATVECGCCEPVQVCVTATAAETIHFISNEEQRDDDTRDSVWTWTNAGDANGPAVNATWYQMYRARYGFSPSAWSVVDSAPTRKAGWISPHPNGATATTNAAGEGPTLSGTVANPMRWWARASFNLPAAADPDSIRVQVTALNADQVANRFRLNTGPWTNLTSNNGYQGSPYTFGPGVLGGAQPGTNTLYFEVLETVPDDPSNGAGVMAHFIVTYDVPGLGQRSWTRMVCCDGSVHYLDEFGVRQDELPPSSMVIPCGASAQPLILCDDIGAFIRHVAYLGDQVVTTDTDLNGSTYVPVGPVRSCGA